MAASETRAVESGQSADEKLAAEKLAAEKLAVEKLAAESLPLQTAAANESRRYFSVPLGWCLLLTGLLVILLARGKWNHADRIDVDIVIPRYLVDLNSASQQEFEVLPEVGEALASRIVQYRETHGPFENFEALMEVRGVGARTLEQLRPMLMIDSPSQPEPTTSFAGPTARLD